MFVFKNSHTRNLVALGTHLDTQAMIHIPQPSKYAKLGIILETIRNTSNSFFNFFHW